MASVQTHTIILILLSQFLFPHLILQHFLKLLARLRITHFHLGDQFAERDSAATLHLGLLFVVDGQLHVVNVCLQMLCIFLFFSHKNVFLEITLVNLILF
jgi:hypothetical protein